MGGMRMRVCSGSAPGMPLGACGAMAIGGKLGYGHMGDMRHAGESMELRSDDGAAATVAYIA